MLVFPQEWHSQEGLSPAASVLGSQSVLHTHLKVTFQKSYFPKPVIWKITQSDHSVPQHIGVPWMFHTCAVGVWGWHLLVGPLGDMSPLPATLCAFTILAPCHYSMTWKRFKNCCPNHCIRCTGLWELPCLFSVPKYRRRDKSAMKQSFYCISIGRIPGLSVTCVSSQALWAAGV